MNSLEYTPGSLVTIVYQTLSADGYRQDGYSIPFVNRVILPDLTESSLYPLDMIRIDTGLYYHKFSLPTGAQAIGSYIVDIIYYDVVGNQKNDFIQVLCAASGGAGGFSVSPN